MWIGHRREAFRTEYHVQQILIVNNERGIRPQIKSPDTYTPTRRVSEESK